MKTNTDGTLCCSQPPRNTTSSQELSVLIAQRQERFNSYLKNSFVTPLAATLKQHDLKITANVHRRVVRNRRSPANARHDGHKSSSTFRERTFCTSAPPFADTPDSPINNGSGMTETGRSRQQSWVESSRLLRVTSKGRAEHTRATLTKFASFQMDKTFTDDEFKFAAGAPRNSSGS